MVTYEQFYEALRYALNHLYDPNVQRTSPLAGMLGIHRASLPSLALQQALLDGIASLEPQKDGSTNPARRRSYEILLYRYVQQWSQQELADQLGISPRHLRREQRAALEVLAQALCEKHHVSLYHSGGASYEAPHEQEDKGAVIQKELAWLEGAPANVALGLEEVLADAVRLARPMAMEHDTDLVIDAPPVPPVNAHPSALRQLLLSLLAMGVRHGRGGSVIVSTRSEGWSVGVTVAALAPSSEGLSSDDQVNLNVIRHLLRTCRGRLETPSTRDRFAVKVILPASEQVPVLAIDDNEDALALIRRFLTGTSYRFMGTATLDGALAIAQQTPPRIILMDVMMPVIDGWELMGRLRQHPSTSSVPIIVCTILAEEDLALSLGASGFIRKPFGREALLQALDRLRSS